MLLVECDYVLAAPQRAVGEADLLDLLIGIVDVPLHGDLVAGAGNLEHEMLSVARAAHQNVADYNPFAKLDRVRAAGIIIFANDVLPVAEVEDIGVVSGTPPISRSLPARPERRSPS